MRKSRSIALGLVQAVSAAALAGGCGSRQQTWQACVDHANRIVEDQRCEDEQRQAQYYPQHPHFYHYYYYRSSYAPAIGLIAPAGGDLTRPSGSISHASSTSSVTRGGFGSTAASHASSGGSGGES